MELITESSTTAVGVGRVASTLRVGRETRFYRRPSVSANSVSPVALHNRHILRTNYITQNSSSELFIPLSATFI